MAEEEGGEGDQPTVGHIPVLYSRKARTGKGPGVEFEGQPAEGFALVQSRQARTRGKPKLGPEDREAHAMAVITLDLERGGPERRRKDGDKAEDDDRGGANVRWERGGRGDWCDSVRVGAPGWRSHT